MDGEMKIFWVLNVLNVMLWISYNGRPTQDWKRWIGFLKGDSVKSLPFKARDENSAWVGFKN